MAAEPRIPPAGEPRRPWLGWVLGAGALVVALAGLDFWTSDDAFISFRYAANLVEGHGLVFNPGERVEAYTNFLWTVWCAAGLALGFSAEGWSAFWGVVAYLAAIALLGLNSMALGRSLGGRAWVVPLAALGAAVDRDWSRFASSGLETAPFALCVLAGVLLVTRHADSVTACATAGGIAAFGALLRPEGALAALVLGGAVAWLARSRFLSALAFAIAFLAPWAAHLLWRQAYYGDWVPNTFYAKSADLAWWDQGFRYVGLYFERYWVLLLGPLLWLVALFVRSDVRREAAWSIVRRQAIVAGALAGAYVLYVARVGGDFMFARFLVPVAPCLWLLLETGCIAALGRRLYGVLGATAVVIAATLLTPSPVSGTQAEHGVIDEREYYSDARVATLERKAERLRALFDGVPVRVVFYGDEARVVYRARFPFAVEGHAALTEPEIARRPLARRGRPGHEKIPDARYLIEQRGVQITFSGIAERLLDLRRFVPTIVVELGDGFTAQLLRWDPQLVAALERRGVAVPRFPELLDQYIARLDSFDDARVAQDWERFRRFYFDHVDDVARAEPFHGRLSRRAAPVP